MSQVSQSSSQPQSFASRFSAGAAFGIKPALSSQNVLVASYSKSGKSYLCADCPYGLLLNFDLADTPPRSRAGVWPIRKDDGNFYEPSSTGLKRIKPPEWKDFLKVKEDLVAMSARNEPDRPRTVFLDSMTAMATMVIPYIVEKGGKTTFKDMGQDGWAERNRLLGAFVEDLHRAGYGVWTFIHLSDERVPVVNQMTGTIVSQREVSPTVSNGLWNALTWAPSIIASIELKMVDQKDAGGRTTKAQTRVFKIAKQLLNNQSGGCRVPLPDEIVLGADRPWDDLTKVFDECVARM